MRSMTGTERRWRDFGGTLPLSIACRVGPRGPHHPSAVCRSRAAGVRPPEVACPISIWPGSQWERPTALAHEPVIAPVVVVIAGRAAACARGSHRFVRRSVVGADKFRRFTVVEG